jgi:two-component sensor histidine kinase
MAAALLDELPFGDQPVEGFLKSVALVAANAQGPRQRPEAAATAGLGAEVLQELVGGHEFNISRREGVPG